MKSFIDLFLMLTMAHFVCDFTLQNDRMAVEKVKGKDVTLNWRYWLIAHGATHGLAVGLLLGSGYGFLEWVAHALTDYLKGRGKFTLLGDQIIHIGFKLIWVSIYTHQT